MNIAVVNLKGIVKNSFKFILEVVCLIFIIKLLITNVHFFQRIFSFKVCSSIYTSFFANVNEESYEFDYMTPIKAFYPFAIAKTDEEGLIEDSISEINNNENQIEISKSVKLEPVSERNILENYNLSYSNVKIRNQSDYELTDDIFSLEDMQLTNNRKILIYHTHTCESYTPSDNYNYQMTGNYRTTDKQYNVVRLRR